jgi:phenylacetate-CoA ligase
MIAAYGWWWYRRRFSGTFHKLVAEFQARDRWSRDQFTAYQAERLSELFRVAKDSPYYRPLFGDSGVTTVTEPFEALRRLPLLTKETLRTRAKDLLTSRRLPRRTMVFKSSGTTGTPSEIYYSPEFHAVELAAPEARNLRWAGLTYRHRRVMFGVRKVCPIGHDRPPFWRFSPAERLAYASVYHLNRKALPHYLSFLRSYRPAVVMGYPSALHTIARYALETGDLPAPAEGIFTVSETLTDEARSAIERAWQSQVYDRYGAVEGCVLATQCPERRYHVSPEIGIIEIIGRDGRPAAPGELGQIVATGLRNSLQPLIRYEIGDVGRWAVDQSCPCGRQMPILEAIEGRFEDMCYTAHGEFLRFDTVFKGIENIREAQVVQRTPNSFSIRVVPAPGFMTADIEHLRRNMRLHVGNVHVDVECVDAIARTAGGKFKAVVCQLSETEKRQIRLARTA